MDLPPVNDRVTVTFSLLCFGQYVFINIKFSFCIKIDLLLLAGRITELKPWYGSHRGGALLEIRGYGMY